MMRVCRRKETEVICLFKCSPLLRFKRLYQDFVITLGRIKLPVDYVVYPLFKERLYFWV